MRLNSIRQLSISSTVNIRLQQRPSTVSNTPNEALANILLKMRLKAQSILTGDCPCQAYMRAIIAARKGDAATANKSWRQQRRASSLLNVPRQISSLQNSNKSGSLHIDLPAVRTGLPVIFLYPPLQDANRHRGKQVQGICLQRSMP